MGKTTLQLNNLSLDQLNALKDQFDNDIASLQRAYENLRAARIKFQDSKGCLESFKQYQPAHQVLVPLSSSLYVTGELLDTQNVLVDVGTGYFIKQSVTRAQEFFAKRVHSLGQHMDSIAESLATAKRQHSTLVEVMRSKMQARQAAESRAAES